MMKAWWKFIEWEKDTRETILLKHYTLLLIDYPIKLIIHFERKNSFKQASE